MIAQFPVGAATVSVFSAGDLHADVRDWLALPDGVEPEVPKVAHVPTHCVHIALGDHSVLVDAPRWDFGPGSEDADLGIAGYTPPPPIPDQLRAAGIDPGGIQHIVITHAHNDHINGLTALESDFTRAMVLLGKPDWESERTRGALAHPHSVIARSLGYAAGLKRLTTVSTMQVIARGPEADVTVLAAPGESPGHQIVRLRSQGAVLYCLGDLYHHTSEPASKRDCSWADPVQSQLSRAALEQAALREDALLVATHIPGAGRFVATPNGVRWTSVPVVQR